MGTWSLLFLAFGLAICLEGLPYFISPAAVRRYTRVVAEMGDAVLRTIGFLLMVGGLLIAWLASR